MPNPLEQAIQSGIKANDMIGDLIADIGTESSPRGYIQVAYRNANRAMQSALQENNRLAAADDVLVQLRDTILRDTRTMFAGAQEQGAGESAKQMRYYKIQSPDVSRVSVNLSAQAQSALDVITATVDRQAAAVRSMVLIGSDDEEILGNEDRAGVLRPSDPAGAVAFWATALLWDAFDYWTTSYSGGIVFQKQAIAALDARTTDCCLRVHAQVQPLNRPFHLTGVPRFADYVDWPAFHAWCRTAGVLYQAGFDEGLTAKMRSGADYFLDQRAKGKSPDRDPANAF
jgi:hypothetical protein